MSVEQAVSAVRHVVWRGDARLEVRDEGEGDGSPLLLLHGVGGSADTWSILRPLLLPGRRLVAWSAPGYAGSSPFEAAEPDLDDYASAAIALLDGLGIERADLLGHSMGGLIAARVAVRAPQRVRRMVLADCSSGHRGYDPQQRSQILGTRMTQDASDPWVYARARAPKLLSPSAPAELVEQASAMLARLRQPGFGQAARMVSSSDIFEFASAVRSPTTVICGSDDAITPVELNQRIALAIPGASHAVIEGAGHWSFLERPAAFAELVLRHVD